MTKPTMKKPTVGQMLYSLNIGNAARFSEQVLTPVVVTLVGRKYFTVQNVKTEHRLTVYRLDNWTEKSNYSANSRLYETEQELLDEKEAANLCSAIGADFQYGRNQKGLALPALRQIMRIIEDGK